MYGSNLETFPLILDERKAQEASEYQWQKDRIKALSEENKQEEADRDARNRAKRLNYRQDLFGQMHYEQRKKQEVREKLDESNEKDSEEFV